MEANRNIDLSSETKEPKEYYVHVKVETETKDIPVKEIKRETEFEEIDIKKEPGSPECNSITPVWFEVPVKKEKDSPEIKYSNTQDYLESGVSTISEPTKLETATSSTVIKVEITEVDPEREPSEDESEEYLMKKKQANEDDELGVKEDPDSPETKYSNTEYCLEIEEAVIKEPSGATASISAEKKRRTERKENKSGAKPYKCEICDDEFKFMCKLQRHMRTHTGEKSFKCETCDYRCTRNDILKNHMRTHTGEKPYKCEACDYRCAQNITLQIHMRTHTGEMPYKCDACDYRCSAGSRLKRHMRTHTGEKPFKCDSCDYRCTESSSLKRHMRTHTGEKPFKCEACDYRCTESGSLKRHIRRTHTGE